jgi:heptosyltransferase-3
MYPGLLTVGRSIYWGIRRNPKHMGHRFSAWFGAVKPVASLWALHLAHRRQELVIISLVESMGDIIAAEPIARAARERYPKALIVWLVRRAFVEVVDRFDTIDKAIPVGCLTEAMILLCVRPRSVLWDLHVSDAVCSRCRAPLPKRGAASKITLDTYYDIGNLLTVSCLCAGIPPIEEAPRFEPGPDARAMVDALQLPERFVVLHCTSNDRNRNWRADAWDDIAAYIHDTLGWAIVEIGLEPVTQGARTGRYRDLCGKVSIPGMAEVVRRAGLFIGVDSGPAHLANAAGTPGILLFGRYGRWDRHMPFSGPYQDGSGAIILRHPGPLNELPVATVRDEIHRRIGGIAEAMADRRPLPNVAAK